MKHTLKAGSVWGSSWEHVVAVSKKNKFKKRIVLCEKCTTIMSYALFARHKFTCNGIPLEKPSEALLEKRKLNKLSMRQRRRDAKVN